MQPTTSFLLLEIQSGYYHAAYLPTCYREEVEHQINIMLEQDILLRRVAAHGWHQQCLYGRNLVTSACVWTIENSTKKTIKDAYPLPLRD